MQLVLNISKFVVLAVLSWFILVNWYGKDATVINLTPAENTIPEEMIAPVDSAPTQTTASNKAGSARAVESIWSSLSSEFKLDHRTQSTQVKAEIRKLLADQEQFHKILKAASPYIYFIHKQTQAKGLPAEIALIPLIESEFNPNDRSHKGATGLWQLMRATATELGIKVISGYDGRRNVVASTKAALAYLNDLGNYFKGNWYLAFAAYNAGQFKIDKAIRHAGDNSFWNLSSLPKETKFYVPKLLAVAAIVKNPEKYGVKLPAISNEPYFSEIKLTKAVSLEKVAKSSETSLETLRRLNPDYKQGIVLPKNGVYTLLVPVEKSALVKSQLSSILASK